MPDEIESYEPELVLVLGSGLSPLADKFDATFRYPYSRVENLPIPQVPGHTGEMVGLTLAGKRILIAVGRSHLYEGHDPRDITALIRLSKQLGAPRILMTNAAGCINPTFEPGNWMVIADHLNLMAASPLTGGPHFIDCSEVYSLNLRKKLKEAAREANLAIHEGVYAAVIGPQYETPAEIRMLQTIGADAVGMSTVLEAIQARALGIEVAALSCLTNWASGVHGGTLNHSEVVDAAGRAIDSLAALFERFVAKLE